MKTNNLFLILFFLILTEFKGQSTNDVLIGHEYYRQGDFEKAAELLGKAYKKNPATNIYDKYIDCLIKIQDYKKAEKTIKSFYKKTKNPTILIDLGVMYDVEGKIDLSQKTFSLALKEGKENKKFLAMMGDKFFKKKKYDFALKAYLAAKNYNKKGSYYIKIANTYSYLGDVKSMYQELIELIRYYPHYSQTCKNMIRRTISDDEHNLNNTLLKKTLIKNIQKNNSLEISKLIVWLFMQEKKFQDALDYEISIDKQILNNTEDIVTLAEVIIENQDFTIAISALNYVLKHNNITPQQYEYVRIKLIDIEFLIFENKKIKNSHEALELKRKCESVLEEMGVQSKTISILTKYCHILNLYLEKEDVAVELLQQALNNILLTRHDIAECKIELANILISTGDMWDAILLYSQVEKDFKDDVIGQKAKFEKTKINYYQGDFEWAQNQLKVLQLSTSKLIANNAIKLSLLISDNLNLDTTNTALLIYAKTELLIKKKKWKEALVKLIELDNRFPNHSLTDESLFKKFEIFMAMEKYTEAIESLEKICTQYYYDILYDDALFYQAQIYDEIINDTDKAKEKYEELLLKTPNSIFTNKARERYRALRNKTFLKL